MVVSNQATPRIMALYEQAGFDMMVLSAPRRISNNGDRTPAQEMLAYKNITIAPTEIHHQQLTLF